MKTSRYIWIVMGVVALVINWLFGVYPWLYEWGYFRSIFQILRVGYDYSLGWVPFPMVYVLFLIVVQVIYRFLQFKYLKEAKTLGEKLVAVFLSVGSLVGAFVFFFYFFWGFNYQQKTLSQQLEFPAIETNSEELFQESLYILEKMKKLRNEISKDTFALTINGLPKNYESTLRTHLEYLFDSWNFPTWGRVRVRHLRPKGTLLRISTAGVYIPFVFEGHIDAGLHPIQYPFTLAHEMSHGYGITDEGTCNFTGLLACMYADDPYIQYSAYMSFWRYMSSNLRKASPSRYSELMKRMSIGIRKDLVAVMKQMDKYPDILPAVRDKVYDSYLKKHGVAGGLSNYSTVVGLYLSWKKSDKNHRLKAKVFAQ